MSSDRPFLCALAGPLVILPATRPRDPWPNSDAPPDHACGLSATTRHRPQRLPQSAFRHHIHRPTEERFEPNLENDDVYFQGGLAVAEQELDERGALHLEVRRYVGEDRRERPDPQDLVIRDRDMVLAVLLGREPHVAPGLASNLIPQDLQGPRELAPGEIPRQPHAAMISSRT